MALYRINHPATGRVVNLYISSSTGSVPHGTPLSLYPWQNNSDQKFEMEYRGDYVIFRLQRDTSQVINRNASNNQAMVWPFSTDQATLNDSLINTETEGGNMRIKLVHQGLYLTKDSSSNMLYWQPKAATNRQYFTLQQVDGDPGGDTGTGDGHEILGLKTYNYNQKEGPSTGFRAAGCACVCGMDVASFYAGRRYSFAEFRGYYDDYSSAESPYIEYYWGTPAGYTFVPDWAPNGKNEADTIAYIKRYIDAGIPPICHCLAVNKDQHWVVPFKYESGSGWDSIWVLDPYLGVERRMNEAMNLSCGGTSGGVDRIMHHPEYELK